LTRDYLDASGEFTVNVPLGAVDPEIIKVCGSKSGRDLDKIKTLSLTVQQGETVKAPAFKELPLTFECKVLFRQVEALENLAQQEGKWYPADQNGNKDRHIQYIAEITSAYIVK
jgi:flavin reductase (DIM6/NTAB) family NADH-FMN oxidoreductase RutF